MKYKLDYRRWQYGTAYVDGVESIDEAELKGSFRRIKIREDANKDLPNAGWELWDAVAIPEKEE